MSDKIKKVLETPEVPEKLKPENIPALLEEAAVEKETTVKKKKIRSITAWSAAAAACLLIVAGSVRLNNIRTNSSGTVMTANFTNGAAVKKDEAACEEAAEEAACESTDKQYSKYTISSVPDNFAFVNAESYEQIFDEVKNGIQDFRTNGVTAEDDVMETAEVAVDEDANTDISSYAGASDMSSDSTDVYDTLSQVEGIAEADIIKANAKGVYYVTGSEVSYIPFDSSTGKFGEQHRIDVAGDSGTAEKSWSYVYDMYLTGDILTVITDVQNEEPNVWSTAVLTYDVSEGTPEFSGRGVQSGSYSSSRMKGDILYLITNQSPDYFAVCFDDESVFSSENYRSYVPFYGSSIDDTECLDTSCIFIPRDGDADDRFAEFVNISGIDIKSPGCAVSSVSVSGNTNQIYCSQDSIYIAQTQHDESWYTTDTVFAKFSADNGVITPAASGSAAGYVHDQFSMDEYNGYFRAATTSSAKDPDGEYEWERITSNNLFVFDSNMNVVGSVTGFAETETVKSVNFSGDIAYVVTYERTDPLFAIDLSEPSAPVITDEFKINGYSTFIWKWNEDLLLGFGVEANDDGIETGVKLTMFDISDSDELDAVTTYSMSGNGYHSVYSEAVYSRKALLLSPEKNIIAFPLTEYSMSYGSYENRNCYIVFEYDNGQFKEKGQIRSEGEMYDFQRAVYIGNYLCVFSQGEAVSANLENMKETDRIKLETNDKYLWID